MDSRNGTPSISMQSLPGCTGLSGSRQTLRLTATRPARTKSNACEREQYPAFDKTRATPTHREESTKKS